MKKLLHILSIIFATIASILFATGLSLILYENIVLTEIKRDELNTIVSSFDSGIKIERDIQVQLPPKDINLSKTNIISISRINLKSEIIENKSPEIGLEKGIWRVTNFGTPEDNSKPIILAAHRYGTLSMFSKDLQNKSFYNLPKLKDRDTITIIYNQREYIYEIVSSEESTKISNYNYDLILYTCKSYNTPIRIFKYANRIN